MEKIEPFYWDYGTIFKTTDNALYETLYDVPKDIQYKHKCVRITPQPKIYDAFDDAGISERGAVRM